MDEKHKPTELEDVVIRFAGDSGDGMQLVGTLFSDASAYYGNDIVTFPDYPAEIRAPQGTVGGVSGFTVHFGHTEVNTPGDYADLLVSMNPASLKASIKYLKPGATIIVDIDAFTEKNIKKAGYKTDNPFKEEGLEDYNIISVRITSLTKEALKDLNLDNKMVLRSKNMFVLGMVDFMFSRPLDYTLKFFEKKFAGKPAIIEANKRALKAGFNYAENSHTIFSFKVAPAKIEKGKYRNINGNTATAWGFIVAAEKAGLELFCGSYPITPASEILQELSTRRDLGVKTFQAEDEIAGIVTAIGASFAGDLAITTTSGPGLALKTEATGLAVITEVPLVIVDVQRGGPSTGLPTKTEQADLFQSLFGRNGESPLPVIAALGPADAFYTAIEASRIALEHMTPIIMLTDSYTANGSQPFKIPDLEKIPEIKPPIITEPPYLPYERIDKDKMIRGWAKVGVKGLEHRLGSLEKMAVTGTVSYVPENHEKMVRERQMKVDLIANYIPLQKVEGYTDSEILLIGWGSTYGHIRRAVNLLKKEGIKVAYTQFKYINPLPKNTEEILKRYKKTLVIELNSGQFANYLRMKFPGFDPLQYNKIQGLPFTVVEIVNHVKSII